MDPRAHLATMVVAALCHLCRRPTTSSCRACGLPTCSDHLDRNGFCDLCRGGRLGPRAGR